MGKNLKGLIFFVLAIALQSLLYGQNTPLNKEDGGDWLNKFTDDAFRKVYWTGYIAGVVLGVDAAGQEAGKASTARKILEIERANTKNTKQSMVLDMLKDAQEGVEGLQMYGITIGQVNEGMNAFYSDFANRRIKIIDAIFIVKMQIDGRDPDQIQAQIRYLRMPIITQEEFQRIGTKSLEKPEDVTEEENLKRGYFIDKDKVLHVLFRYGDYR